MSQIIESAIVCQTAPTPNRINEDACLYLSNASMTLAAVIDGASQRIAVPAIQQLAEQAQPNQPTTTAAYVAQLTRDYIQDHPHLTPSALITGANDHLRAQLSTVIDPFSASTFAKHVPDQAELLQADARWIRLMLPVCVATVIKIDHLTNELTFAHVGDTALFTFNRSGDIERITADQMDAHDAAALNRAQTIKTETGATHLADVLNHPDVSAYNRNNGLYHNFVDENGYPDTTQGVGAIDGLPEISAYIQTGQLKTDTLEGLLLCSDGFQLPAPLNESAEQTATRLMHMREWLTRNGLREYLNYLRQVEADDHTRDRFPRFKIHDDATGIYLRFT